MPGDPCRVESVKQLQILASRQGTRLASLTGGRIKSAAPFGDQFRLTDTCAVKPVRSWSSRDTGGCWFPTVSCSFFPAFTMASTQTSSGSWSRVGAGPPDSGSTSQGDADLMRYLFVSKSSQYFGYALRQGLLMLAIAVSFGPVGILASMWEAIRTSGWHRWTIVGVASAIVPTMLFGRLPYPPGCLGEFLWGLADVPADPG